MDNNILSLIGLCKKAGRLEAGEEPVGAACRAKDCRLLLVAANAAENTRRRAAHFAEAGQCLLISLPCTKEDLGRAVGASACAMAAITDVGFASSVVKKLAEADPTQYGETAQRLEVKAQRAQQRRKEQAQHEKNVKLGKVRPKREPSPQTSADALQAAPQEVAAPTAAAPAARPPRTFSPRPATGGDRRKPYGKPGERKPYGKPGEKKPYGKSYGSADGKRSYGKPYGSSDERKPYSKPDGAPGERKPYSKPYGAPGERKPYGSPSAAPGERKPYSKPYGAPGERKPYSKPYGAPGERKPYGSPSAAPGERKPYGSPNAAPGERKPYSNPGAKPFGRGPGKPGAKPYGKPGAKPYGKPGGGPRKPFQAKNPPHKAESK